jgi:hypothetical protein
MQALPAPPFLSSVRCWTLEPSRAQLFYREKPPRDVRAGFPSFFAL